MNFLLDTTYFLPLIGVDIAIEGAGSFLDNMLGRFDALYYSEITFLELASKSAKYIVRNELDPNQAVAGLNSLLYDNRMIQVSYKEPAIIELAWKLHRFHKDFLDCLLVATAKRTGCIFVTEDTIIHNILSKAQIFAGLLPEEPGFTCVTSGELRASLDLERV